MLFPCSRKVIELFCTKQRKSLVGIRITARSRTIPGYSGNYITPEISGRALRRRNSNLASQFDHLPLESEKLEALIPGFWESTTSNIITSRGGNLASCKQCVVFAMRNTGCRDGVKIKRVLTKFGVVRGSPGIQNLIKDRERSPLISRPDTMMGIPRESLSIRSCVDSNALGLLTTARVERSWVKPHTVNVTQDHCQPVTG